MHKQLLNEIEISFRLEPDGPLLVKASDTTEPGRPDMEFVRTRRPGSLTSTIYLPGSSLKGAIRAHAEKLARSVRPALACNPLAMRSDASNADKACSQKFEERKRKDETLTTEQIYRDSCFVCQLFGNTYLASHLRLTDALLSEETLNQEELTEQRNGVAIDRLFGSVAVGPFQFEVATGGNFAAKISIRNFTLAQLGLMALVLRDLERQRLLLGFGKSRGLGRVKLSYNYITLRYPMAGDDYRLGSTQLAPISIYGVGALGVAGNYNLPANDFFTSEQFGNLSYDDFDGLTLNIPSDRIIDFWRECAAAWKRAVTSAAQTGG